MKLYQKIFISIFSVCLIFITFASLYYINLYENNIKSSFELRYQSLSKTIGETFVELEKTSEKFSFAAINALYERDKLNGLLNLNELMKFKEEYGVNQVVVANSFGEFIRDTKVDPKTYDLNLFKFCDGYRSMLDRPRSYQTTPIILSAPPIVEPIKYTMMSNFDKTRILEIGVHLDFMEEILRKAMLSNPELLSLSLVTPSGTSLGRITKDKGYYIENDKIEIKNINEGVFYKSDRLYINSKMQALVKNCCECKMKAITASDDSEEYYYLLLAEVDALPILKEISSIRWRIFAFSLLLCILLLFISLFLSKRITDRFNALLSYSSKLALANKHSSIELKQKDEIDQIVYNLNSVMDLQIKSHEEGVKASAYLDKYNTVKQFAHDIKSPLSVFGTILSSKKLVVDDDISGLLKSAVRRINELSEDILEQVKTNNEVLVTSNKFIEMIKEIIDEKNFLLKSANAKITINLNHETAPFTVSLNEVVLKRILSNILNNSIEAIKGSGNVNVKIMVQKNKLIISVKDDGSGINSSDLSKVLKEGFTTKPHNTGLGLYHADQYLRTIGGMIDVDSDSKSFTEVKLTIPTSV